jgi:uncharacterized membrane protein
MGSRTAITVNRPIDETRRMWDDASFRPKHVTNSGAAVTFREAPGDRGTEIHVELSSGISRGKVGTAVERLRGSAPLAKAKDDLRHFKQLVETGVITRSEGTPEGERAQRKFKQRPAQPLEASELAKAGV